jgi:putative restriction endonuclease
MESDRGPIPHENRSRKQRIPQNILREHVLQAIDEIKKIHWPPRNNSIKYDVLFEGTRYPPKILVMYANKYVNEELFDVSKFSGGEDTTNKFFRARGFEIVLKKETDSSVEKKPPNTSRDQGSTKEKSIILPPKDQYSTSLYSTAITSEIKSRLQTWHQLKALENAQNLSPDLLREQFRIYRGAAGIWCDKGRTSAVSGDEFGITISVLHTGKSYPDDVGDDSIIYHYPKTDRPGTTDLNEINATKNAKKFNVPIFIITHAKKNDKLRDVRFGYVIEWNDANKTFLIEFSQTGELQVVLTPAIDEQPFELSYNDDRILRTSNSSRRNPIFRFNVLKRYGSKCAVCSMTIDNLLSAAHIVPKGSSYSNDDPRNGIVLCHNHHNAFDTHLFGIHPDTKKIVQRAKGPLLSDLKIECDCLTTKNFPHTDALRWQYKKFEESLHEKRSDL